jgi:integrase
MLSGDGGHSLSSWCLEIGLPVRAHGLRKRVAKIVAEGGTPTQQLKAYFGWSTDAMAAHCTRRADARMMALQAARGLNVNALSPHLRSGAGPSDKIAMKSTPGK